jgi:tetratricopeptide (TPR) repeat protein
LYEHFEPSEQVFVDREEYIAWMSQALERCRQKPVLLHLRGIGGIGKSTLLNFWLNTVEGAIRLDCQQYADFYSRLNSLAKGAALVGIRLQRFDILWQIRQRFVEGVEPVRQEGREWAKEIAMAIPFIGSLASIGSAINAASSKITPTLKRKYSAVGKWLEERLGKNHVERLLEILWKEPRNAEFLYVDALLEDLNSRSNPEKPILILLDHFEYVDHTTTLWSYRGRKISEAELWCVFLSTVANSVDVVGSRRASPLTKEAKLPLEERELTELNEVSARELLEKRRVPDVQMQNVIVSVSGGNPFVIDAICDMKDAGRLSIADVESLRSDTLDEVRLLTWRKLFDTAVGFQDVINRAGLLESFDRRLMDIIAPSLTTDLWDQLLRLSFVRPRDDDTWVLHDLARDLIIAELGERGRSLAEEVAQVLKKRSQETGDPTLIANALSVRAIFSEEEAIREARHTIDALLRKDAGAEALRILDLTTFRTTKGKAELQGLRGRALDLVARLPEAEEALREAIRVNEELARVEPEKHLASIAEHLCSLCVVLQNTRVDEASAAISRALQIQRGVATQGDPEQLRSLARILVRYGLLKQLANPLDGVEPIQEAVSIYRDLGDLAQVAYSLNALGVLLTSTTKWDEAEEAISEATEIQRALIESEPINLRHRSLLAAMLNNLAFILSSGGDSRREEQLYTEALQIRRSLADADPDVQTQRLVHSIWNLGVFYASLNRLDEAEKMFTELLQTARENAKDSPDEYDSWIERAHRALGFMHAAHGRMTQAISSVEQAVEMCRKRVSRGASILDLAVTLEVSGAIRMRSGEYRLAEEDLLESIETYRNYGELPQRSRSLLASCLNNQGIILRRSGRLPESRAELEEALRILREDAKRLPMVYDGLVSKVLCNLALTLVDSNLLEDASPRFKESLSIAEQVVEQTPERYRVHLGRVLHNYSSFLLKADRPTEAYSTLQTAVDLKRQVVSEFPGIFEESLIVSLRNLFVMARARKSPEAEAILREVLDMSKESQHPRLKDLPKEQDWEMEWEDLIAGPGDTP